ncbi:MAG: flavodoxin domain-containing protein [Pseudobdellovibrionaceae bacterium]
MNSDQILIVYASRYGQTEKIASSMQNIFQAQGFDVDICRAKESNTIDLQKYSVVILGSSVYIQRTDAALEKWAAQNQIQLQSKKLGLFTVSLNAATQTAKARQENEKILNRFEMKARMKPAQRAAFIGALNYTKYSPWIRFFMKQISRSSGGPVDTSRDHELTQWDAVERFAQEFIENNLRAKGKTPPGKRPGSEPFHVDPG